MQQWPVPDARDEFTLLCEGCGYVLEGLPVERNCPECGRPIAHSLPARRAGSPWQQRPGVASWWRTVGLLLRHPAGAWGLVRIEPARQGFGRVNVVLAALLISVVAVARLIREARIARATAPTAESSSWSQAVAILSLSAWVVLGMIALWGAALLALAFLTQVETWGVRFFGNRRGWRVTPTVADAVCGHASVGWLIAAVMWAGCALLVDTGVARRLIATLGIPRPSPSAWLRGLAPLAGFLLGLLVFEFLVFFGVRRNRFANRSRPAAVQLPLHP